jgi:Kef-type K+ transport system membrane component KefB
MIQVRSVVRRFGTRATGRQLRTHAHSAGDARPAGVIGILSVKSSLQVALVMAALGYPLLGSPSHAATSASAPASESVQTVRFSPNFSEFSHVFHEHAQTYRMTLIIFQVALILAAAKVGGWAVERIKVPGVIGELLAGAIIGPFLVGSLIKLPLDGYWVPLFPAPTVAGQWPINDVVWAMAQFASVILLFVTGLHTDLKQFLRYVGPAAIVAAAGVVLPFVLGFGAVYIPAFQGIARHQPGESLLVPALFVGAILAATSVGITARVLGDLKKLDTPEGVTIIGAAVIDDVLGIIVLAIVGGIAAAGSVSLGSVGVTAAKALGFWIGLTVIVLLLAKRVERLIKRVQYAGAMVGLGLALAFACSGAAEGFGLAFIIGAYSVGLGLSQTKMAHDLLDELRPISDFIVPVFFAALGMLVDFDAMLRDWTVIAFGLVVTLVAILGKVFGCGGAAFGAGFSLLGAYRVGVGMMPRGEVALIVAGIGLSRQIIQENVFGVSIMMTLVTTVVAPIMLVPAFRRGGSGRRGEVAGAEQRKPPSAAPLPPLLGLQVELRSDLGRLMLDRLIARAESAGWARVLDDASEEIHLLRRDADAAHLRLDDGKLQIHASGRLETEFASLLVQVRDEVIREASIRPSLLTGNAERSIRQ